MYKPEGQSFMNRSPISEFPSSLGFGGTERKRFAAILAGGEGSRLKALTREIAGDERPKQFCTILNNRTLLDKTKERVALNIETENIYFSLTQKHEKYYERDLWSVPESRLIVQPQNRGTAPAILYSLIRLAGVSPMATVAFFPSDHYFTDDEAFMNNVESAYRAAEMNPNSIVLLGIEPNNPETSYGWIEPTRSLSRDVRWPVSRVKRFWEKPSYETAKKLMEAGCLWNSFVMVGKVEAFLDLYRQHLSDLYGMFAAARTQFGGPQESTVVRSIYGRIAETNFSSDVLEKAPNELLVMRAGDTGWSDWGEPQRVLDTLTSIGVRPHWLRAAAAY